MRAWIFSVLLSSVAIAQTPPAVVTTTARAERLAPTRELSGEVVAARESTLAAKLAARVVEVVETGRRVRRGEVVARLDDAELKLAVARERARLQRLLAEQSLARRQRDRLNVLSDAVPAAQRDEAQARFEVLGAEIAEAKVAVELAELSLGEATIRAPFDGTVIAELKQAGEQIQAGEGIARLADLASIEVDVAVPVDWALSRQADVPVRVDGPSGHAEAKLLSLVPTDAGTHQLRARLALPTGAAPIGARVRVAWPASEPVLAVTVPRDALIQRDEGYYVLRIDGDLARRIDVRPSTRVADRVAVIGAVGPGDEIVIRGGERLADGDKVAVLSGAVAAAGAPCVGGRC